MFYHIQVKLDAVNNDNNTRIKVFAPRKIPLSKKRPGKFNFLLKRKHNCYAYRIQIYADIHNKQRHIT